MTSTIPQPPAIPFIGNVRDIDNELPIQSFALLAKQYGEIYQLMIFGKQIIHCNSHALVLELSDDKRFKKINTRPVEYIRELVSDALFTARIEEPNWEIAHRMLMPVFGPANIRSMEHEMRDITDQMTVKWERFGPDHVFDLTADLTRLAFDTITLCAMSHRLNSFYKESFPPAVQAMSDFMEECWARTSRLSIVHALMPSKETKFQQDMNTMNELVDKILAARKANPAEATKKDLLQIMLNGKDPKTGQSLPEDNIKKQLLTFLIAGHETTSGTMSFASALLLKNPEALAKMRKEIDEIIGNRQVTVNDLPNLPYSLAVLRETLRLYPSATARAVKCGEDTTIGGGKYFVKANTPLVVHTHRLHRDPAVWGDDADEFRPERMLDGKFEALPPQAWQPFGYGARGCIGRGFALQEAQIAIVTIFQKFDLILDDPSYNIQVKQVLSIKPHNLFVRAVLRSSRILPIATASSVLLRTPVDEKPMQLPSPSKMVAFEGQPIYILYGSNTGSCESFAQRIANESARHGCNATLGTLDSMIGRIPSDAPVVILCSSFEGQPPDNAAHFIQWLMELAGKELEGINYAVFGCGNKEWVQTYQRIPRLCDDLFAERGAQRLLPRGEADAAGSTFFQSFDNFEAKLWEAIIEKYSLDKSQANLEDTFQVNILGPEVARARTLRQPDISVGTVVENRTLTRSGVPQKRHIELALPKGMSAEAGDYLAILPHNPPKDVQRVLSRFGLTADQEIIISSKGPTTLPTDRPVTAQLILSGYVELSLPATTRDIQTLQDVATSDPSKAALQKLFDTYTQEVLEKRLSVLDILEAHPDIDLPFAAYLHMIPTMRVRQYSISSSPLWNPEHVALTVSIIDTPSLSGSMERFLGVTSNYLAILRPGDRLQMVVRPSNNAFHPPEDLSKPVIMFCAGSGLAPFRGFIQERAIQKASGREIAKTLLFFGCRSPEDDYLYSNDDLKAWTEQGVVELRPAFSRAPEKSEGCKYIQDRIWHARDEIEDYWQAGAKFYTCGSGKIAMAIKRALMDLIKYQKRYDDTEAEAAFNRVQKERYATDIFD